MATEPLLYTAERDAFGASNSGLPAGPSDPRHSVVARLRKLWQERHFLAKACLAGLLAGVLLCFFIPNRYQSSVQLMPPGNQSSSGMLMAALTAKGGDGLGGMAGDLLGVQSSGDLFLGILRSRTVQDRLVERFGLNQVYGAKLHQDARTRLAENTGLGEDRKSGILTITVTDRDPKRATALAQGYVEELDRLVAEVSTSAAHRERLFLEERLKAVKVELDQAALEFSHFASKNAAIDIKEQGRALVDAAATLQGQLIAAQSERMGLEQIYAPGNVRVRAVQARIAELQRQLRKLDGPVEAAPEETDATPKSAAQTSMYPSIRSLPLLGVTSSDLLRRIKTEEAVYWTLTQEYELSKVEEAKETPSVKILDAADLPERRSFPPRLLIVMWCATAAVAAATVWILARQVWQETDPADPAKALAADVFRSLTPGLIRWRGTEIRLGGIRTPQPSPEKGFGQGA